MTKLSNYCQILALLAILGFTPANAGEVYLELGVGWIDNMPVKGTVSIHQSVVAQEEVVINIDQPYMEIAIGITSDSGWYAEVNRFGIITESDKSLTRFQLGKRWGIKF